jgi:hypothetical protein
MIEMNEQIINGQKFEVTGWYRLIHHGVGCFIPDMTTRMFFKKGETAPLTGSCNHEARWELIEVYKK